MKTSSLRKLTLSLIVALSIGSPGILRAELGDHNPTGIAGQFNGNVTTGCSYDPFTGNATRSITDIVVPGAVGAYPLAFTRTINTRSAYPETWFTPFGRPGGWRHSYQWELGTVYMTFSPCAAGGLPDHYTVTYPDGREVTFGDDGAPRSPGIGDRFQPIPPEDIQATNSNCYLLLSDGGRVHFTVTINHNCDDPPPAETEFVFGVAGIMDPYGQETTFRSEDPTPTTFTITVTEPAGRNLTLCWVQKNINPAAWVMDRVEERPSLTADVSRTVEYLYENYNNIAGFPALTSVKYFSEPSLTARYSYQASPAGSPYPPLIKTCNDTMYSGAMSKIAYDFAPGQPHGFLLRERYFDGVNAINGPAVSTLAAPNEIQRSETRGDGPMRTFTYNSDLGLLTSWTDFRGKSSSQEHYLNASPIGFVKFVRNALGKQTDFGRDPLTGKITQITHPPTPSDLTGRGIIAIAYDPNHRYHMAGVTDERTNATTYGRDSNARVTDIFYPDIHFPLPNGHEEFRYDNPFGQVTRHKRQNGNYEHMQYDARGLLIYRWNPTASSTAPDAPNTVLPKTTFEYYALNHPWRDRVKTVTDPRGKTTTFEYDRLPTGQEYGGRGLVSRITHHDNRYLLFGYDARGNRLWEENELRQRTSYTHDDYNRVTEVTTPLPGNRTATITYAYNPTYQPDVPSLSPYLHTAGTPTKITTPTGVVVENRYDENGRLKQSTRGPTAPEPAITRHGYDEVGNLTSVRDPRNYETVIDYDERNRRTRVTGPPISAAGNDHYITKWLYDPASNVRTIILPDDTEIHREYDEMNRLETNDLTNDTHQEHRVTLYTYWPSGQLRTLKDPNNHLTVFEYDERDLQTKMTYPNQPGSPPILEGWVYDENGNMKERPTIGGPKQVFSYDDRNRLKTMRWSNGIDFSDFDYDEVGRLTSAVNPYSSITRQYDVGGRLEFDRQVLASTLNPPSMTITPIGVVSRKSHGSAGSFDINLPLTGAPGIECRIGSNYTLVLTFGDPISVGGATVNSGIGDVTNVTASGNVVTVSLANVSNAQVITVRVFGLSDGWNMGELIVPMHVLMGATTGHSVVNEDDSEQTDNREGQVANSSNFRSDVNTDGFINSDDVTTVTITAGADVPASPAPGPQADVTYGYDDDGNVKRLSTPAYIYDYAYDGMGRVEWIMRADNPNEVRYQYSYDRSSNVIGRTSYTNNTSLSFIRDEVNRITEETILSGDDPLSHLRYAYDTMSRLESTLHDEDGLLDDRLDRFGYNFAGELNSAEYGLHPVGGWWLNPRATVSYVYDNAGNRSSVNGTPYSPNALNQYTSAQGSPVDNGSQHEISSYQGKNYSYLADTQLSGVSSGIGSAPGNSYRLGYDALGRTVRRTMNGEATYFIYAGPHPIIEYDASGNMLANTLYGLGVDEIISRNNHGAGQFLMQDRTGSTVAVTGPKGELLEKYRYDAFGTPEIMYPSGLGTPNNESTINNRFLFTGREWVSRFGFYENRARAYHPGLGRFMSEDPLGFGAGDANLFRYCGNDPVNWTDPSGLVTPEQIKHTEDSDDNYYDGERYTPGTPSEFYGDTTGRFSVGGPGVTGRGPNAGVPGGGLGSVTGGTIGGRPGGGDVGGGPGGRPGGTPRYSGSISVNGWPTFLTLPYTTPATPEQAAWTDTGKWPTMIYIGLLAAPEILDAVGAEFIRENLHFDGPKGGRIGQIRFGTYPLVRLDYHPYPGTQNRPRLHLNFGRTNVHIPVDFGWY